MKYAGVLIALLLLGSSAQVKHNSDYPLSAEDWKAVMNKVDLLEFSG